MYIVRIFVSGLLILFLQGDKPHRLCKVKNVLCWCEQRPLTWDDFKGKPDAKKNEIAGVSVWFVWSDDYVKEKRTIKIAFFASIDQEKSWKIADENSEYGLHHEQMHFNIQEVFARRIRKAFQEMEFEPGIDIKQAYKEIDRVYTYYRQEASKMQDIYDDETQHSVNREKQKEWDDKIMKDLEALKGYSNPEFDIILP